jgi:signal peptidase
MKMKKIYDIIIFFLIVTSPLLTWQIAKILLHNQYPIQVIVSDSMSPTLNIGDIVLVENIDPKSITIGTVIAFQSPRYGENIYFVHRVIGVEVINDKYYFRTKGDANDSPDSWLIPETHLIGRIIARIPLIGYLVLIPRIYLASFIITIVITDVIYVFYLKKILKENKRNHRI